MYVQVWHTDKLTFKNKVTGINKNPGCLLQQPTTLPEVKTQNLGMDETKTNDI